MFQFHTIPASRIQKKPRALNEEKTLEEKFQEKKQRIARLEKRKLREFHFLAIAHQGFLYVLDFQGKEIAKFENPDSIESKRAARAVYAEKIAKSEKQEGGCYFDFE